MRINVLETIKNRGKKEKLYQPDPKTLLSWLQNPNIFSKDELVIIAFDLDVQIDNKKSRTQYATQLWAWAFHSKENLKRLLDKIRNERDYLKQNKKPVLFRPRVKKDLQQILVAHYNATNMNITHNLLTGLDIDPEEIISMDEPYSQQVKDALSYLERHNLVKTPIVRSLIKMRRELKQETRKRK